MDQVTEQLVCRHCGKAAKSKSGLTNHEKTCLKAPKGREEVDDRSPRPDEANLSDQNRYDRDPRSDDDQDRQERHDRPKASKTGQWQVGAFFLMPDHIPMLLDIDFCSALSAHILEHGSPNSAIMAFAHQLNKVAGD